MKQTIIALITLLISMSSFAQSIAFNYKAIVKDDNGNPITNTLIVVQFTIYEGAALTNNVYQEQHTPTTDANGLVILNIGDGTSSDEFLDIAWKNDLHFLNVQINSGSGFVDLGTTQFMFTPYAMVALEALNVSGLELVNGIGLRLAGRNPANYGTIGFNAVDFSTSFTASEVNGATGDYSTAFGFNTIASGDYSIAMGEGTNATGFSATAMGLATLASGNNATAMGTNTFATADNSLAIGWLNIEEPNGLFVVGNGSSSAGSFNQSNALVVLNNGTITAPSFDVSEITDDKALITKEYLDTNLITATGLEQITENSNIGWRLNLLAIMLLI